MAQERVSLKEKVAVRMSPRCKQIATSLSGSEKHSSRDLEKCVASDRLVELTTADGWFSLLEFLKVRYHTGPAQHGYARRSSLLLSVCMGFIDTFRLYCHV